MSSYSLTKARTFQYVGILLVLAAIATGYWYFFARAGATLNKSSVNSLTSGLVGYWTFDGADISGTTATDRSGSGNDGTLTNGPTRTIGKLGQGLSFDFVDDVVTTSQAISGSISATTATLSAWVKPGTQYDTSGVPFNLGCIICDSGGYIGIYRGSYAGIGHDAIVVANYSGSDYFVEANSTAVNTREWAHIVLVHSGGILSAYSNGVFIGSVSSGNTSNLTGSWKIGSTNFNGTIDEARVYNRALSASEIKALYDLGSSDKVNASASQPQGTGRLDSGLAGYWKLDENTGTTASDTSTNAIAAGTLTNGPTWATGRIGSGVDFDGLNDYTTITDPGTGSALDFSAGDTITITAWINPDTLPGGGQIIASKGATTGSNNSNYQFFVSGTGQLTLGFNEGSTSWNDYHTGEGLISTGTWQFVVATMTYESGTASGHIYHNGAEQGVFIQANPATNAASVSNDPLWIGAENEAGGAAVDMPFDGKLDEVRIYRRALSADEVADLYRLTTPTGVDTGLKGYWSFNGSDINGTTATDRSGSGNNGTLTNGPTKAIGKIGQGLSFDGVNDYIGWGAYTTEQTTYTAVLWFKYIDASTTGALFFRGDLNTCAYNPSVLIVSGTLNARESGCSGTGIIGSQALTPGWHHVAVTRSGQTAILYFDGVSVATDTSQSTGNFSSGYFSVGASSTNGNPPGFEFFNSSIDEVRVYNRALSASEIKSLYDLGASDKVNTSISQPQGTGRLDSGLALYWPLDASSGATATDSSTNANNGTLTNMEDPGDWVSGQIGNALDFDGSNEYVTLADPASGVLDFADSATFTLTGWFNRDTFTSDDYLVAKSNGAGAQGYGVIIPSTGDLMNFFVSDGPDVYTIEGLTAIQSTGWHHFAAVWGETSASLYIDGQLDNGVTTGTISSVNSLANAVPFRLGIDSDGDDPLDGKIDDVRIYNRALSADEVADLYRLTTPTGVDTGLKGYWSFNGSDMSGTTATDRSGSGNDGTLTNGPTKTIGKIGQGLQFNGTSQYVSSDVPVNGDITLSAWIYPTNGQEYEGIIARPSQYEAGNYRMMFRNGSRLLEYQFGGGSVHTSNSSIPYDQWSHVVVTFNDAANSVVIYVNGAVDYTGTETVSPSTANAYYGTLIGASNIVYSDQYFEGKIDEARIYNRTLSATEITAMYNIGR